MRPAKLNSPLEWNDLRYILFTVQERSATAAAAKLHVSHSTVLRRLQALERAMAVPLFERSNNGYVPTAAARTLADLASNIEGAVEETRQNLLGSETELKGRVCLTTTDSFASTLLPQVLRGFREHHPQVEVELRVTNASLNLDQKEADIALRATYAPPDAWVGIRLCRMDFAVYAAKSYLRGQLVDPFNRLDWIAPAGQFAALPVSRWLHSRVKAERIVMRGDSFLGLRAMAQQGMGATLLPCFLADVEGLTKICNAPRNENGAVWLLTHSRLRHSARVKALMQHLADGVRAARHSLEDSAPIAAPP